MATAQFVEKIKAMHEESEQMLNLLNEMSERSLHMPDQLKAIAEDYKYYAEHAIRKAISEPDSLVVLDISFKNIQSLDPD